MSADQRNTLEDQAERFLEWLDEIFFQLGQAAANGAALDVSSGQVDAIVEALDRAADEAEVEWHGRLFDRLRSEAFRGYGYEALSQRCAS